MKWLLTLFLFLSLASAVLAQEFNAGFVQGLWYQDKVMFANTPTRIYVAVRNNTGSDLTGTVDFFDNNKRIERNNISALSGRIIESWADWTPTYGEHTITATISRTELHQVGTSTQAVEVISASSSDTFFVDYDTDGDGIGNKIDTDDDNDGITDATEESTGTNPLDANDPSVNQIKSTNTSDHKNQDTILAIANDDTDKNDEPKGLEKYTDEGQLDDFFSSLTNTINSTKGKVDYYRSQRNIKNNPYNTHSNTSKNNGVATSTTSSGSLFSNASTTISYSGLKNTLSNTLQSDDSKNNSDSAVKVFDFIISGFDAMYSIFLLLLSSYLANPAVVQISFLLLLLLILFKITRKIGRRRH